MNPLATINIKNCGQVTIELFPEHAPQSVASFIYMAKEGVYNKQPIKRIVPDFVIQPSYKDFENDLARTSLDGEFDVNGIPNGYLLRKGSLALAGDGKIISSASCFFWVLSDEAGERLQGKYAGFGQVIDGWTIINQIQNAATRLVDIGVPGVTINEPIRPIIIESIIVDTFGLIYDQPELINSTIYN